MHFDVLAFKCSVIINPPNCQI